MRTIVLMKYMLVASALELFITCCTMSDNSNIVPELTRLEQEFVAAPLCGDNATVDRLLANDFMGINLGGRRLSKKEVRINLKSTKVNILDLRHEDIRIAVFDCCTVATARTVVKRSQGGEKMEGLFPYMRVWIKRGSCCTQSSSEARSYMV
jgi:hypothetical protein